MVSSRVPPVLLTMPTFNGTLAAVRSLGKRGIPVTIAGDNAFAPAGWSRYVSRRVSCPTLFEPDLFLDWLLEFGRREPGHVLYPSCDDLAWLFAHHADALSEHYLLYQPPAANLLHLLDKEALSNRCAELGIPTPRTLFPRNLHEALLFAEEVGFPLLLKPRTQMFLRTRNKGQIVMNRSEFAPRYAHFVAENSAHPVARELLPHVDQPMLQTLVPDAERGTYSIAGFIARDGGPTAVRAALKVLQRPRRVGIGVCFEEAEVEPAALEGVLRLCESVGYHGVFEAEFLSNDGILQLVDFNPRFYGQMGFEAARELDLPYLAWLGAIGEREQLARAISQASSWDHRNGYVFCDRFYFDASLFLQGLSGGMSAEERRRWREWLDEPAQRLHAFDAFESHADPWPAVVSKMREIFAAARHPRSFYRKVVVGTAMLMSGGADLLHF